ncbi:hypothetical protein BZG36_04578 [Bifiguratus adelaidae]|uniref:RNA polymerase Rpb4/RPC9 core domain-containing protein n=1 Tax=Bifiguratus adelaidae TaxID=1938954 RepID=A0A261XUP3_9FUNG|nr:hypothetical protein BZG36_04578 [Bifiguratus adelaidae]
MSYHRHLRRGAIEEEDATTLKLGSDFQNESCLFVSEVRILLEAQMGAKHDKTDNSPITTVLQKTLTYVQNFSSFTNKDSVKAVRDDGQVTLGALFTHARQLTETIEESSLATTDPKLQSDVARALQELEQCSDMVRQLSMFSANERVNDIGTPDLKFLLVDALIGDLLQKKTGADRANLLKRAKANYEQYLGTCELHGLLLETDRTRYEENKLGKRLQDASRNREAKIAQYKREKQTKSRIQEMQGHLLRLENRTASSEDRDSEEIERDLYLNLLDLKVQQSFQALMSIEQELELLQGLEKYMQEKTDEVKDGYKERLDPRMPSEARSGPLLSKEGKPLRPFIITNKREQLQQEVFRPSWSLPTMTIDEYLEQERQRGNIIEGGGQQSEQKKIIDEDEEDVVDAETYKQRQWDEFKEANPRGWGKSLQRQSNGMC